MKALVVGSGAGSLASALRLRALGLDVEVLEACPDPGGRARTFTFRGESFDAGPTVITAPWLFDELFELFGEHRRDHVEFVPCDPWYRLQFADGSSMDLVAGVDRQEREIAKISPRDAQRYRAYLQHSEELYRVGYEELGAFDFSGVLSMARVFPALFKLGGFRSLWRHTGRYFEDDRVRQAFSLQTLLVGGNPLTTTAIYGLIHAMERRGGIWFAKGGTGRLIEALVDLARRHGVRFTFGARVDEIVTAPGGEVTGIGAMVEERRYHAPGDLLVWGGDPEVLYWILGGARTSLVERFRAKTVQSSMGLYVLYFKTAAAYHHVAHHTIVLSKRWHGLLRDVFRGQVLPNDPSLYLHRPAATDPRPGATGDLFYVLAPVPHLGNFTDWPAKEGGFRAQVLSILEERLLPGLSQELQFAEAVDPRYFRETLQSPLGAGFSIAPVLTQSAWFRFHNRADRVPNLYLCGAGVHPGGGLPGVVTSAKLVEKLVGDDLRQGRYKGGPAKPVTSGFEEAA
jgi:phytoene desaturase